jgi:GNAT superfamily N-acetyltransferase
MTSERVREISPNDRRALKGFVTLERQLLGHYPLYVSNFDGDVTLRLSGKSAFTRDVETALFVAAGEDGRDIARCAGQILPRYQAAKQEKVGFIGYFAAAPDCDLYVAAMLARVEGWLKDRGIQRVIAPFNTNAMIGTGFLTAAFEEEPVMFAGWNPAYYPAYLLQNGYQPAYPLWVYEIDLTSEKFHLAEERARENRAVRVRPINKRRWDSDLEIIRGIVNENFTDEWEWYPASTAEFREFFGKIKPLVDPRQFLIAEIEGKPAGVRMGFPNWNPLARSIQGKFGFWQTIQFLLHGRRYETAGFAITAVKPEYRGMGISPLLGVTICHRYQELGVKKVYSYYINEINDKSRHAVESIGGVGRVLYHTYDKKIGIG